MADIVTPEKRSEMMSGIRGKDTKPEMIIRRGLHARGFRYRLHAKALPGKPDLVFKSRNAVIQVNGCFWHGHGCSLFKWPKTKTQFWKTKINATRQRDRKNHAALKQEGWRVLIVWECASKNKPKGEINALIEKVADWLDKESEDGEFGEQGN